MPQHAWPVVAHPWVQPLPPFSPQVYLSRPRRAPIALSYSHKATPTVLELPRPVGPVTVPTLLELWMRSAVSSRTGCGAGSREPHQLVRPPASLLRLAAAPEAAAPSEADLSPPPPPLPPPKADRSPAVSCDNARVQPVKNKAVSTDSVVHEYEPLHAQTLGA